MKNKLFSFLTFLLLPFCFIGCKNNNKSNNDETSDSFSPSKVITEIDSIYTQTNLLYYIEDYILTVHAIKNEIDELYTKSDLSNDDKNIALDNYYKDFLSCTDYYKKLDFEDFKLADALKPYEVKRSKLHDISNELDEALAKYPDFYTGTEQEYKTLHNAITQEILSWNKSYDLNIKYGNYSAANKATQKAAECRADLSILEQSWKERQIIEEISNRYTTLENQLYSELTIIFDNYEQKATVYQKSITSINLKYGIFKEFELQYGNILAE